MHLHSSVVEFFAPVHTNSSIHYYHGTGSGGIYTRNATLKVNPNLTDCDATLKQMLTKSLTTLRPRDQIRSWDISIEVGINATGAHYYDRYVFEEIHENQKDVIRVRDTHPGGVLENLSNNFGGNVKIKTQILNIKSKHPNYNPLPAITLETPEEKVDRITTCGTYGYEFSPSSDAVKDVRNYWHTPGINYQGTVIITVFVPNMDSDSSIQDVLCINRKMLKDEVACDVTIIPNNQVPIKCHKNFLCAHSTVLDVMFQTQMKESKTSTVEMPDMSEQSVRAFLEYLYLWEVKAANKSSLIAFELLHAGHKYDIKKLEESMEKILLSKESIWYNVDVAMKLFLFARNHPEGDQLKMKAIQVLKANFAELEKSRSYQQLFQKDPKAAMELCKYAFST